MSTKSSPYGFAALGLLLLLGSPALGQEASEGTLATAKTLKCAFRLVAIGTWKNGEAELEVKPRQVLIGFDSIDVAEGTAVAVGPFGRSDLTATLAGKALYLIQMFRDGHMFMTAVFDKETRPGKLTAVHSRHEYPFFAVPGFSAGPEQHYGECEVGR